jgi:CSLREA domain-containing protein
MKPKRLFLFFSLTALVAAVTLYVLPTPVVRAATINVTSTSGGTGGPDCTLRDAITAANTDTPAGGCPAGSGADTIVLAASGVYGDDLRFGHYAPAIAGVRYVFGLGADRF